MVRAPKIQPRVAARYVHTRVEEDLHWGKAYDQGNQRFPEADVTAPSLLELREKCRENVGKSFRGKVSK